MSDKLDIANNEDRLALLRNMADVYTSSGYYKWKDIYVLMPKFEEDETGDKFIDFLVYFEYWILLPRVNPDAEPEYFCELAKALIKGKVDKRHRLPLGNIPALYKEYCTGDNGGEASG